MTYTSLWPTKRHQIDTKRQIEKRLGAEVEVLGHGHGTLSKLDNI